LDTFYQQQYHGGRHGVTARICDSRRLDIIGQQTKTIGGKRLLDIGCGDGTLMAAARSAGWSVMGTETHPDRARQRGLDVVTSLDEATKSGPFDVITMWHSLEHFKDPNDAIESVSRLIDPGGVAIVAVPNYASLQATIFGRHWLHLDVPRHLSHFTMNSIDRLAQRHGMTATRIRRSEFEYDLMGWIQSGLNAIGLPPNLLMKTLTGRTSNASMVIRAISFVGGCVLGAATLLPTVIGCQTGRGGTLIFVLRRAR
tara:strand:+ start:190825 stop:191592 length:768 start_codon:yes stop_codon:yes gene_type:complete